jgi:hypothetical protein
MARKLAQRMYGPSANLTITRSAQQAIQRSPRPAVKAIAIVQRGGILARWDAVPPVA